MTSHTPVPLAFMPAKQQIVANEEIRRVQRGRVAHLESVNADLLAALQSIVNGDSGGTFSGSQCVDIARAAIAKATGAA